MRWPATAAALLLTVPLSAEAQTTPREDRLILGKPATWSLDDDPLPVELPEPAALEQTFSDPCVIDSDRLARARAHFGPRAQTRQLWRHVLYTDLTETRLLEFLDALAKTAETVYLEQLGLPIDEAVCSAAVVLLENEKNYALLAAEEALAAPSVGLWGHAHGGVAVVVTGVRSDKEIGASLLHELTHLLNAQILGPSVPPWLDEGLALSLAAQISSPGELDPEHVNWKSISRGVGFREPPIFFVRAANAYRGGQLPPLWELAGYDRAAFLGSNDPQLLAVYGFLWVRFLLDPEDPPLQQGFRLFLASLANGEPIALREALGRSWEQLDGAFLLWLAHTGRQLGLRQR